MTYANTIALDGPAGSGKSTVGKRLADQLGYFFLDTGILYRAITRHALNENIAIHDADAVESYARSLSIEVHQLQPSFNFQINGQTLDNLNTPEIDRAVPIIAAYHLVREKVRFMQRQIAARGSIILAGRDIGVVVLPHADLKIYLDVSLEERAARRYANQNEPEISLEDVKQALLLRDQLDMTRAESPLQIAEDAVVVTTDGMTIDEVVALMMSCTLRQPIE
jgi:CMP/dCMP kinase